jgi:hypothetical protein
MWLLYYIIEKCVDRIIIVSCWGQQLFIGLRKD